LIDPLESGIQGTDRYLQRAKKVLQILSERNPDASIHANIAIAVVDLLA
jgi:hypothetical protein